MIFSFDAFENELPFDLRVTEPDTNQLLCYSRRAMATTFEFLFPSNTPDSFLLANEGLNLIDELEEQLSVYRVTSEISLLNQRAFQERVVVEENLFDLLVRCAEWTRETEGAFDIAIGALIKSWGFYRRAGRVPTIEERVEALQKSGIRNVLFDYQTREVKYLRQGLEINLGAVGKGYALDCVAKNYQKQGISSAFLQCGGSSAVAIGKGLPNQKGWPIRIRHPYGKKPLGIVSLSNAGIGTSAATYQYFEYNGKKLGHLIDPRTGWPNEALLQASVIAPTASEADALSTAFFLMGENAVRRYCETRPDIGAILLTHQQETIVLNLSPEVFSLETD